MTNQLQKTPQRSLQSYLRSSVVKDELVASVGQSRANTVVASLMSLVNNNIVLQECEPKTVFAAALTAASLDLPINPSLGQAYIIPFNNKVKVGEETHTKRNGDTYTKPIFKWVKQAQFQMGYKGFIQLCLRSGKYELIHVNDVRDGEYKGMDRMTGEHRFEFIEDDEQRKKVPVIGFVAYIKLTTGFHKSLYMTNDELLAHAKKYSKSFKDGYGQWVDDFDAMAKKTVLKLLIDKFGIKTSQIEKAMISDQAELDDEGNASYVDNKDGKAYVDVDPEDQPADES